jgi:hypothetical protein
MRFAAPAPVASPPAEPEKKPREPRQKRKNAPHLIAAARELRDRWLEQVNTGQFVIESQGKYDVSRWIDEDARIELGPMKLLNAA